MYNSMSFLIDFLYKCTFYLYRFAMLRVICHLRPYILMLQVGLGFPRVRACAGARRGMPFHGDAPPGIAEPLLFAAGKEG